MKTKFFEILTMDVTDNRMGESMAGKGHKNFCSTFSPDIVVCWTPTCNCAKQETKVIFSTQFFRWARVATESH